MKDNNKAKSNIDKIAFNEMYKFFENISKYYLKNKKQELYHPVNISKNLIFDKKNNKVISNFDDANNGEIFTINDFIYNSLEVIDKKLFNKVLINEINLNISNISDNVPTFFNIKSENIYLILKLLQ